MKSFLMLRKTSHSKYMVASFDEIQYFALTMDRLTMMMIEKHMQFDHLRNLATIFFVHMFEICIVRC